MIDYFVDLDEANFVKALVSVIIPAYNAERCITRALLSAINQTYKDYEIIVVDDGSTDGTFSIISPFLDDLRIRYFHQSNRGRSNARNRGIRESHGEYIAFLDADDEWLPEFLSTSIAALCSNHQIGYSYSWGKMFNAINGEFVGDFMGKQKKGVAPKNEMFKKLILGEKILFDSIVVKRKTLKQVGGLDTRISVAEDWDFSMRLTAYSDGYCTAEPLVNVYQDIQHQKEYQRRNNFEMYLMVFENLKNIKISEENQRLIPQSLARELYTRGVVLLAMGDVEESSRLLNRAYDIYPSLFLNGELSLSFAHQFLKFYDGSNEFSDLIFDFFRSTEKFPSLSSIINPKTIISSIYGLIVIRELRSSGIILQSAIKAVKYDFLWLRRKEFLINCLKAVYRLAMRIK
ncbi:MAG: glycosyltransferase [Anaerolineales bacterium]|jgi:glycosyltransferase involved in cell wall biosynthesis|nr:glycosyltransferase [Anaerolineales bacterium]GER80054.1 glycosyltransferase [Candidatus Denitrolinea symbiosum]